MREPRAELPVVGREEVVAAFKRRQPRRVHHRQPIGQRARRDDADCRDHARHRGADDHASPRARRPGLDRRGDRHPDHKPRARRRVHEAREGRQRQRRAPAAAEEQAHGHQADGKGEHARVKAAFVGVDAGAGNAVPQRQRHQQRRRGPARRVQPIADERDTRRKQRRRQQVAEKEQPLKRQARGRAQPGQRLVEHGEPRLRRQQHAIAREQRRGPAQGRWRGCRTPGPRRRTDSPRRWRSPARRRAR